MNTRHYEFYIDNKPKLIERLKDYLTEIIKKSEEGIVWISEDNKKIEEGVFWISEENKKTSENFIKEINGEEWVNKDNINRLKEFLETIHTQDKINNNKEEEREEILKFWRFRLKANLLAIIKHPDNTTVSQIQAESIVNLLCSGEKLTRGAVNYCLYFIPIQQLLLYISDNLE